MISEQIAQKKKLELKQLNRFKAHIPVLKVNAGLSDEAISELLFRITDRISQCEMSLSELGKA